MFKMLLICIAIANANLVIRKQQMASQKTISNNCELNVARFNDIDLTAGKQGLIILIARLGKGETSRSLNQRRLFNAKTYLAKFLGRANETVITAEGDRKEGYGCIEVYVQGRLSDVFEFRKGEDLNVGSCDRTSPGDELFFRSDKLRRKSKVSQN